jgi:hypothetical protein
MHQNWRTAREQRPARRRRWKTISHLAWITANIAVVVYGASSSINHPVLINDAYSRGIELMTANHFTPGPVLEIIVLGSVLASARGLILPAREIRRYAR